jgi:hypothetical protein
MSILDKLNRRDSIETKWTILEDDWLKLRLLRMNSNEFKAR